MKLWCDVTSVQVKDHGNSTCMIWSEAHEDSLRSSWFPEWEFLAIRDCLAQNIEWTSLNMKDMKLPVLPSCLGEEIIWAEACRGIWILVVEIGAILDFHGPQGGVRDIWPMYGPEDLHSSCNGHDGLDGLFSDCIVVMYTTPANC